MDVPELLAPRLADWLAERLLEERLLLERRHADLRGALLRELAGLSRPDAPPGAERAEASSPAHPSPREATRGAGREEPATLQPDALDAVSAKLSEGGTPRPTKISGKKQVQSVKSFAFGSGTSDLGGFHRFVNGGAFESTFAVLIIANAFVMGLEMQYSGLLVGREIDFMGDAEVGLVQGWPNAELTFETLELVFGIIFTLEVLVKIAAMRADFCRAPWNVFDTVIVLAWLVSEGYGKLEFGPNPMVLRVCRLVRLLRLLRLMKMTTMFDTLVLMVSSIHASAAVLLWGVVLLFLIMTMCAFLLHSSLEDFVLDLNEPEDIRLRVYGYFGTYSRSMVTMFEVTLASWVAVTRLLSDHVDPSWAIFFVAYKCTVGFAVLKVITGVFLHETFRCANLDDDLMIQQRRRMRNKFKAKMLRFFSEADLSHNGEVSLEEFALLIEDERVNTWLEAMDLRIRDVGAERVFSFLAGSDMRLTREELCTGMSRLRGAAQGLDVVTLLEVSAPDLQLPAPRDVKRLRDDKARATGARPGSPQASWPPPAELPGSFLVPCGTRGAGSGDDLREATSELWLAVGELRRLTSDVNAWGGSGASQVAAAPAIEGGRSLWSTRTATVSSLPTPLVLERGPASPKVVSRPGRETSM